MFIKELTCPLYRILLIACICPTLLLGRSAWRKKLENTPTITTRWTQGKDQRSYTIADSHIEKYPLFTIFDQTHFNQNKIPQGFLVYHVDGIAHHVDSTILMTLCEQLAQEVTAKKRKFTHFKILQKKNFNRRHMCGLLVVKFNDYPFVVKLFIENPQSLINYWCKGFEPIFFWNMGNGAGRHICGLTRIGNQTIIKNRLACAPFPLATIDIPRKWFWEPKKNNYINIDGINIGMNDETCHTQLPGMYAIIADYIAIHDNTALLPDDKKYISMSLCNHLDLIIDPHANNYMFNSDASNTLHITLIDTEYFPVMVGLKKRKKFETHFDWYAYLIEKCVQDTFYQSKHIRTYSCMQPNELLFQFV